MSLEIVVDPDNMSESDHVTTDGKLVSWVLARTSAWEDFRDTNYEDRWDEYYRLWRGIWAEKDKSRNSERSKLITPALQQAIEATVAELEEATFGKGKWFDVKDDVLDEDINDINVFRDLLQEDLDRAGARSAIAEVYLNSALYGTGIGKIITSESTVKSISSQPVDDSNTVFEAASDEKEEVKVELVAISPYEFAIDPSAKSIDDSLGCAHIFATPRHNVLAKQEEGIYKDTPLGSYVGDIKMFDDETSSDSHNADKVKLVEYHGLVPRAYLDPNLDDDEELVSFDFENQQSGDNEESDTDLVEAIVTIANDSVLLRADENPNFMKDRAFIAYQHDTVPNRFWGRGIAEKGYWPQKANDAEVRARIDAMALTVHPMMGVDVTRIPKGSSLKIKAGATILTQGDPSTVLRPFNFGQVSNQTFHQSGELERMVQMGTGAMDSAAPTGISPRNSTASGMSMISSGAIKRAKRTMANIELNFLVKFVEKAAWRKMQFEPDKYKTKDIKFIAASTLGLMARELEQQQLTTLLQTTEPNGTGYWMLMKSIYENSSISDREEMVALADQKLQQSLQPAQPSPLDQMKMQEMQAKLQAQQVSLQIEKTRAETERLRVMIEAQKADSQEAKDLTAAMLNVAKAEAEEQGVQLAKYQATVDAIAKSTGANNDGTGTQTNRDVNRPI